MTDEQQQYDAPNQQVVRADGSAPWDEGNGGGAKREAEPKTKTAGKPSVGKAAAARDTADDKPKDG